MITVWRRRVGGGLAGGLVARPGVGGGVDQGFPPELVDRIVGMTDTRELRRRLLPDRLVVYFVLALWLFRGPNCGYGRVMVKLVDALYHRRRGQQLLEGVLDPHGWVRPGRVGGGGRRTLLVVAGPDAVGGRSAAHAVRGGRRAGRRRRRGRVSVPGCGWCRWTAPAPTYPTPPRTTSTSAGPRTGTRAGAFPQVRWLAAAESGTGALVGATIGPYTVGEPTLAVDLLPAFGAEMLVLADRNFLSHTLARDVLGTEAHILWRASASFRLTPIAVLADGSYLAVLHPRRTTKGPPITVRVIEYTVHASTAADSAGEEESSEVFALVTDLLDPVGCQNSGLGR